MHCWRFALLRVCAHCVQPQIRPHCCTHCVHCVHCWRLALLQVCAHCEPFPCCTWCVLCYTQLCAPGMCHTVIWDVHYGKIRATCNMAYLRIRRMTQPWCEQLCSAVCTVCAVGVCTVAGARTLCAFSLLYPGGYSAVTLLCSLCALCALLQVCRGKQSG